MAAPRASSFRALHRLAAGSKQVRHLHMTGPSTYSSPILTSERSAVNLPRDLASLRAECKKRKLPTKGSKQELVDRLSADELLHARPFSTAVDSTSRPKTSSPDAPSAPARHFNTSRALKSVGDSSTIDFAYMPDFSEDVQSAAPSIRVPLLPSTFFPSKTGGVAYGEEVPEEVMRPIIQTVSADGTHISAPSAITDIHDHGASEIDFVHMAERIAAAAKKALPESPSENMVRTVWNGLLDDVLGPKRPVRA